MKDMHITKDFYFSALLLSYNFTLMDTEKKPEGVYFKFYKHDEELFNKLDADFIACEAMVNMKKFTMAMVILRKELDRYKAYGNGKR